ncbi:hypothetical protein B296_00037115 [Ensete ventricosum]|uniref:Uncharacterized protein n=1 Tax=Ensete ventricosum TaxID=4639 RepID=A0A426Y0M2_ENSVE|nr:hypothetical protein B296_00037115 [Ensete ventricosum]
MDLSDLRGMLKVSGGKTLAAQSVASTQGVDRVPPTEAPKSSSKRPFDSPVPSDDPSWRHKKVKILSQKHKSRHGKGGLQSHSKGKEPAEPIKEPETLVESTEEDASPVFRRPRSMKDLFKTKVHKDDIDALESRGGPEAVVAAEERASELEKELEKTKRERDEALQRLEASDKELNEARGNLFEIQRLLKEARVRARKMDDELLQSVKALECARAKLLKQAVNNYKESVGFKEGLKKMGRVTYEYGYPVTLARFRSLHPNSEVEEDPFTVKPEDDSVPMER